MTAKTIMMAVAAAMGLAASAGVIEVKFTVKTDVASKVASKVITGLYDQESGKHVFWTTEKVANDKGRLVDTNIAIQKSYFGLVNETEVAKKIGQNAELIWGENDENVLVAGAWGSDKSKSGQVAGTFNGNPATGTWSAKLNAKQTLEALLAKYKVQGFETVENNGKSLIDRLNDDIAGKKENIDDLTTAKGELEQKIGDLETAKGKLEQKIGDLETAKGELEQKIGDLETAKGELEQKNSDLETAKNELEKVNGDLETAKSELEKVNGDLEKQISEEQTKFNTLEGQYNDTTNELAEIKGALSSLNREDQLLMLKPYLVEKYEAMTNAYAYATNKSETAGAAYVAYQYAIDPNGLEDKLRRDVADYEGKTNELARVANEKEEAYRDLEKEDMMLTRIRVEEGPGSLADYYTNAVDGVFPKLQDIIETCQLDYVKATNRLETVSIPAATNAVVVAYVSMTNATEELNLAKKELNEAEAEQKGLTFESIDDYLDRFYGTDPRPSVPEQYEVYFVYTNGLIAAAAKRVQDANEHVVAAENAERLTKGALDLAQKEVDRLNELKAALKDDDGKYDALEKAKKDLEDAKTEYRYWSEEYELPGKTRAELDVYQDNLRNNRIPTAKQEMDGAESDLGKAQRELVVAEGAYAALATKKSAALTALATAIGETGWSLGADGTVVDEDGSILTAEVIDEKVSAFKAKYDAMAKNSQDVIDAINRIRAELGL